MRPLIVPYDKKLQIPHNESSSGLSELIFPNQGKTTKVFILNVNQR